MIFLVMWNLVCVIFKCIQGNRGGILQLVQKGSNLIFTWDILQWMTFFRDFFSLPFILLVVCFLRCAVINFKNQIHWWILSWFVVVMVYLLASKFSSFNFYDFFWVNPNIKFMAKETWKEECSSSSEEEFMKKSSEFVGFHPKKKKLS